MPRASNGRIPSDWLVTLDTGRGRHVTLPTPAVRWYLLRRNVKARTGVTLYITDGMNAYRDWDEQGVGRRNACDSGNCNAAAAQGYSSHGGTWTYGGRLIDAMAFDIGNYWAIPWDVFREECERVGLRVGLITKAIAGIEEPWHVIDLDPYGAAPMGLTLTRGADGVYRLDDEVSLTKDQDGALSEAWKNSKRTVQVLESLENILLGDGKTGAFPQDGSAIRAIFDVLFLSKVLAERTPRGKAEDRPAGDLDPATLRILDSGDGQALMDAIRGIAAPEVHVDLEDLSDAALDRIADRVADKLAARLGS